MNKFKGLIAGRMQPVDEIFMTEDEWEFDQWLGRWAASEQGQATVNVLCEVVRSAGISVAEIGDAFAGFAGLLNDGGSDDKR